MTPSLEDDLANGRVLHLDEIGSTNDEALGRARAGEAGLLWIRADAQTAGRGRVGRPWTSPKGNLHVSLLLSDPAEPRFTPQLAHVAAVALVEAVRAQTGPGVALTLKWPNDLLIDGAKVAGILVEGARTPRGGTACVVGWGVNCTSHPEGLPYATTDLSRVAGCPVTAGAVFAALRREMHGMVRLWASGLGYPAIRDLWLRSAIPIGTALVVRAKGADTRGAFQGLDGDGRLLLRKPEGIVTIEAGDVILDGRSAATAG